MTLAELDVMDHATAWSRGKKTRLSRNHYVAGEGHDSWSSLQSLCARGLMKQAREGSELSGGDGVFIVSKEGIDALKRWRP